MLSVSRIWRIQKGKDSILFFLRYELNVFLHTVEMIVEANPPGEPYKCNFAIIFL